MTVAVECAFVVFAVCSNRCPIVSWCAVESAIGVKHVFVHPNVGCQDGIYSCVAIVHFVGKPIEFARVADCVVSNEISREIQTAVVAFGYQSALSYKFSASRAASDSIH